MYNTSEIERIQVERHMNFVVPRSSEDVATMPWEELKNFKKKLRTGPERIFEKCRKDNRDVTPEEEHVLDVALRFLDAVNTEWDRRIETGQREPEIEKPYLPNYNLKGRNMNTKNILDYLVNRQELPEEMRAAATTVGTSGGFFLSEPSAAMPGLTYQQEGLLSKCRRMQVPDNATTIQLATFQESDWTSKGPFGIGFSPTAENTAIAESDLSASFVKYEIHALAALTRSSRLWWGATANASAIISEAFNTNLRWKLDRLIIKGSGIAEYVGLTNSACRIEVARGAALDITLSDILDMKKSALPYTAPGQNYMWLASPGAFAKILNLEDGGGTNIFIQGAANAPVPKLLGHEIYVTEHCSAVGSLGDLILADLSLYQVVDFGPPRLEVSGDAYFSQDQVAIKMMLFSDGKSLQRRVIETGAGNFSHVVVLK